MSASSPTQAEPLLVVILGPTASGKTTLAFELARRFDGEIVSCDSVAVYRHFEIGTAKPSRDQRAALPHHLLDVVEPGATYTAGDYARQAREALRDIAARQHLPTVVGGTGLYLRALLVGLFTGPQRSPELRERLRARAAERGPQHLHNVLRRLDPAAADAIHANDLAKVVRAVEVCLASRRRMSSMWQEQGRDPLQGFRILRIGLNPAREALYARINQRAQQMFDDGLVEETRELLQRFGGDPAVTALQSLGYKQAGQFLAGSLTLAQAVAAAQQGHRNYAKRQMTWFRREPEVAWLEGFGDDAAIAAYAAELVSSHLNRARSGDSSDIVSA